MKSANIMKKIKNLLVALLFVIGICPAISCPCLNDGNDKSGQVQGKYKEVSYPTPNIDTTKVNDVRGIILHHTAEPTVERSLWQLTESPRGVSSHVVIDTDGTRYVLCPPTAVAWHAGPSVLDGREKCNEFTIGVEFQGNTLEKPLTPEQKESAIEYLLPIIKQYNIPIKNIVTHEMIRNNYKRKYPKKKVTGKVDITQVEYHKFMDELRAALANQN